MTILNIIKNNKAIVFLICLIHRISNRSGKWLVVGSARIERVRNNLLNITKTKIIKFKKIYKLYSKLLHLSYLKKLVYKCIQFIKIKL